MRISPPRTKYTVIVAMVVLLLSSVPVVSQSTKPLKFFGVNLDPDTAKADKKLVRYLKENTGFEIGEEPQEGYGRIIRKLVERKKDEPYVARVTPYVYVVAEMMGAEFEILATYKNMSDSTSYHSWFVVNR